ncbi:MAG: hypothetical protein EPN86_01655 [Nanoarchaeota archaeon]|nr:MAG: hypothetical protein EPN86_01655 [Nanoarchaeota archaeon]
MTSEPQREFVNRITEGLDIVIKTLEPLIDPPYQNDGHAMAQFVINQDRMQPGDYNPAPWLQDRY